MMGKKGESKFVEDEKLVEKRIVAGVARFGHRWNLIAKDKDIGFPLGTVPDHIGRKWTEMRAAYPCLKDFKIYDEIPPEFALVEGGSSAGAAKGDGVNLLEMKVDTLTDMVKLVYKKVEDVEDKLDKESEKGVDVADNVAEILGLVKHLFTAQKKDDGEKEGPEDEGKTEAEITDGGK